MGECVCVMVIGLMLCCEMGECVVSLFTRWRWGCWPHSRRDLHGSPRADSSSPGCLFLDA